MKTRRLRVSLQDVTPEVVRVIDVPAWSTLPELHDLLQAGLGWTDRHLHQFVVGETRYGVPEDDDWGLHQDEAGARLQDLPSAFGYLYDFGDGWEHDVQVIGPGADRPGCVSGTGTCPPEDCGGPPGYAHLLEVLADPGHPEHDAMKEWAGELRAFDLAGTDLLVRQTVGEVPAGARLILEAAAGGVKLTARGRLPRGFVRKVQVERPQWDDLGRPATTEDDVQPLAVLHDVLRGVGLLRLSRGLLAPTRAAEDDLQVVRRLRSWYEKGSFEGLLVEVAVAVLVVQGPMDVDDLAAEAFGLLGPGWLREGTAMTVADVRDSLAYLSAEMRGLDLVERDRELIWRAGPAAATLPPRVASLTQHLRSAGH